VRYWISDSSNYGLIILSQFGEEVSFNLRESDSLPPGVIGKVYVLYSGEE